MMMDEWTEKTLKCLQEGGLLLYPTDTVWGLGCDATNDAAVKRIFDLKKRDYDKPLLALIDSVDNLSNYVGEAAFTHGNLYQQENPTTLIFSNIQAISPLAMGGGSRMGFRLPKPSWIFDFMQLYKKPLISTSANISSQPMPDTYADIAPEILEGVDFVVNLPTYKSATRPSSVISIEADGTYKTLR